MEDLPPISVICVSWEEARNLLLSVRFPVFVEEQQVPEEMEQDEEDPVCEHFLARTHDKMPIGTARLSPSGKVGRLAVLKPYRRTGVGMRLMKAVHEEAQKRGFEELFLHAQEDSIPFYESLGYATEGERFFEAGIPHFRMRLHFALCP